MTACDPPDAALRCLGWSVAAGASTCGPGYRPGSYLCRTCANGFYAPGDGSCAACPVVSSAWDRYRGLIQLLAGVVAFAVVVYVGLLVFIRLVGGSVSGGIGHIVVLIAWALQTIQVVSQVGRWAAARGVASSDFAPAHQVTRVSSTALPPILRAVYDACALIQLQVCGGEPAR